MFHVYKTNPPESPQLIYMTPEESQAQDYCDERNSYLANAGIPSSVAFWYVTHKTEL
jgi:hypothetical protein